LLIISADGTCFPSYIIYKALRLYKQWCPKNVVSGAVVNGTDSGWIDENCFHDYLLKGPRRIIFFCALRKPNTGLCRAQKVTSIGV
jgi:hypothetical protein